PAGEVSVLVLCQLLEHGLRRCAIAFHEHADPGGPDIGLLLLRELDADPEEALAHGREGRIIELRPRPARGRGAERIIDPALAILHRRDALLERVHERWEDAPAVARAGGPVSLGARGAGALELLRQELADSVGPLRDAAGGQRAHGRFLHFFFG